MAGFDVKINATFEKSRDNMLMATIRHYQGSEIVAMIDLLIRSGISASYVHPDDGLTALMLWFRDSHKLKLQPGEAIQVAGCLIDASDNMTHMSHDGSNALWELCRSPNVELRQSTELFEDLLNKGAEDYVHTTEQCTTLMMWLRENEDLTWQQVVDVALLLAENSKILDFISKDGSSALWELCKAPKLDIELSMPLFEILLDDDKVDFMAVSIEEEGTPYFYLLNRFLPSQQTKGLEKLTKLLIDKNRINLAATDRFGDNALTLIAKLYPQTGTSDECISDAVKIAECLLVDGNINVNHDNGIEGNALNALFCSVHNKDYTSRMPFIQLLVEAGINVSNSNEYFRYTPLETVVIHADMTKESTLTLIKLLTSNGAITSAEFLHKVLKHLADRADKLNQLLPAFVALLIDDKNEYRKIQLGQFSLNNPLLYFLESRATGERNPNLIFSADEEQPLHDLIDLFANCHDQFRGGLFEETGNWQTVVLQNIHESYHGINRYVISSLLQKHGADVTKVTIRHANEALQVVPANGNVGLDDNTRNGQYPEKMQSVATLTRKTCHLFLRKQIPGELKLGENEIDPSHLSQRIVKAVRENRPIQAKGNKRPNSEHDLLRAAAAKRVNPSVEREETLAENE